jgi:hypothetical protein
MYTLCDEAHHACMDAYFGCVIDGTCYPAGATFDGKALECMWCDPSKLATGLVPNPSCHHLDAGYDDAGADCGTPANDDCGDAGGEFCNGGDDGGGHAGGDGDGGAANGDIKMGLAGGTRCSVSSESGSSSLGYLFLIALGCLVQRRRLAVRRRAESSGTRR